MTTIAREEAHPRPSLMPVLVLGQGRDLATERGVECPGDLPAPSDPDLVARARTAKAALGDSVFVLGWRARLGCAMQQAFGVPCPACGMTRSVLMTLHGDFAGALAVNPIGPVFVAGVLLLAAAFATGRAWRATAIYGGATAALLVVNWIAVLLR